MLVGEEHEENIPVARVEAKKEVDEGMHVRANGVEEEEEQVFG